METKDRLIEALHIGAKEFELAKKQYLQGPLDLSGSDLSHCKLQFVQMSRANLQNVNFEYSDLTGANLSHSNLRGSKFGHAKIFGVNLHKALLQKTDLQSAMIGGMERSGRICINKESFNGVEWSKEHIEYFISILNHNQNWEITYQILPKEHRE